MGTGESDLLQAFLLWPVLKSRDQGCLWGPPWENRNMVEQRALSCCSQILQVWPLRGHFCCF